MQFTLFATLAAFVAVAVARPQWGGGLGGGFGGGGIPLNDDQNNNVNQNDNQIENELFNFHTFESFRAIDNIIDNFCSFDDGNGELTYLGKRSDLMKRAAFVDGDGFDGFGGFARVMPLGFENLDFNNNQNANVNQNANLANNFLQSFNLDRVTDGLNGGGFVNGFRGGSIGTLMDCFFDDDGILVAGRR